MEHNEENIYTPKTAEVGGVVKNNTLKVCTLYSGSGGNCTYISTGKVKILVDAGKALAHYVCLLSP